jgi:hypothetical protein
MWNAHYSRSQESSHVFMWSKGGATIVKIPRRAFCIHHCSCNQHCVVGTSANDATCFFCLPHFGSADILALKSIWRQPTCKHLFCKFTAINDVHSGCTVCPPCCSNPRKWCTSEPCCTKRSPQQATPALVEVWQRKCYQDKKGSLEKEQAGPSVYTCPHQKQERNIRKITAMFEI